MSKLQAVNVFAPFSRAEDSFSYGLGNSGVIPGTSYPSAVLTHPTWAQAFPRSSQVPGRTVFDGADAESQTISHHYGLILRLWSSQNRRDFVEKWAIFPLDPWKCFGLFSKPGMVVPTFKDCGVRVRVRVRITVVGRVSFNFLSSTPCVGSLMSVLLRLPCAQKIPWGCC